MKDKSNNSSEVPWSDIVRVAAKVVANDSERVQRINSAILKIDEAIKSKEKYKIMITNAVVCSEFPKIIFASDSGIIRVRRDLVETLSCARHIEALQSIGKVLHNAKQAEKVDQALQEGAKVAVQKGIETVLGMIDENTRH